MTTLPREIVQYIFYLKSLKELQTRIKDDYPILEEARRIYTELNKNYGHPFKTDDTLQYHWISILEGVRLCHPRRAEGNLPPLESSIKDTLFERYQFEDLEIANIDNWEDCITFLCNTHQIPIKHNNNPPEIDLHFYNNLIDLYKAVEDPEDTIIEILRYRPFVINIYLERLKKCVLSFSH